MLQKQEDSMLSGQPQDATKRQALLDEQSQDEQRYPSAELPPDQQQLLKEWNLTQVEYPQAKRLHTLFEAQVAKSPEAPAVVYEGRQLNYRELDQRANQLAHYLQGLGVGSDTLVGLYMERSLELVVALLAILKAGGAYVPIDPNYPAERQAFMLQDAHVPILLTQQQLVHTLPPLEAHIFCLDSDWEQVIHESQQAPTSNVTGDNLAYVIYTSGSTGQPKGAMNTHKGICNRLLWMQETYHLSAQDCVLQKTTYCFDVSVWEFFWPLLAGARLVLARPGGQGDSAYLVQLIRQQQVTTLHFVPSMLQIFLEDPDIETCKSLRLVICSGEALPFTLQEHFFARTQAQLHNLYGPTEAAIDVTYWACSPTSNLTIVPIGRPIANTQIYLLDTHLQPVPIGTIGELYIAGVNLARGYLQRAGLTAERFIPDPFVSEPGERMYKTGDLARYLPTGAIEYLGRVDYQVKIRGFRIELGEIETALSSHPLVREAVVIAEDALGGKRLIAYIAPLRGQSITIANLRTYLEEHLPDYMIPAIFVLLEALPLTSNGKVDRQHLPSPDQESIERLVPYIAPGDEVELQLVQIWENVLGIHPIGIQDGFFASGGQSLFAMQISTRIRDVFDIEISLATVIKTPTIKDLAEILTHLLLEEIEMLSEEEAQKLAIE